MNFIVSRVMHVENVLRHKVAAKQRTSDSQWVALFCLSEGTLQLFRQQPHCMQGESITRVTRSSTRERRNWMVCDSNHRFRANTVLQPNTVILRSVVEIMSVHPDRNIQCPQSRLIRTSQSRSRAEDLQRNGVCPRRNVRAERSVVSKSLFFREGSHDGLPQLSKVGRDWRGQDRAGQNRSGLIRPDQNKAEKPGRTDRAQRHVPGNG